MNHADTEAQGKEEAAHGGARAARLAAGAIFVAAGLFKLKLALPFGDALDALGVPLARAFGYIVPAVEVLGGLALLGAHRFAHRVWRGRVLRAAAALLALDMMAAIALVGAPGALGRPLRVAGSTIGGEPWRLPLEVALLLLLLWLARGAPARKRPARR